MEVRMPTQQRTRKARIQARTLVRVSHHRFNASSQRPVQQKRRSDCPHSGFKEGLAEGTGIRHADADLLYQSRRSQPQRDPQGGVEKAKKLLSERIANEKEKKESQGKPRKTIKARWLLLGNLGLRRLAACSAIEGR